MRNPVLLMEQVVFQWKDGMTTDGMFSRSIARLVTCLLAYGCTGNEVKDDLHLGKTTQGYCTSKSTHPSSLPHGVIVRVPGLLPMLYRPGELAQDLEIPESTLRDWLGTGLPHQRDERRHIWINGQEFAEWVKASRRELTGRKMSENEAYCFRCQQPVKLVNPAVAFRGKQQVLKGVCPDCGTTINRGSHRGQSKQLSTDKSLS
jgi:hypothetical protein